jgi:hypothetical protein
LHDEHVPAPNGLQWPGLVLAIVEVTLFVRRQANPELMRDRLSKGAASIERE